MSDVSQLRPFNDNPWADAYCWLWYNAPEIFTFTQDDFDRKAKELADRGVTIAITFSVTHFRLGFYPYWDEINAALRKIVLACHKYGIRVVEHHSAHLTYNLTTLKGWQEYDKYLADFSGGRADYEIWKKCMPFLTVDFSIGGKDLRSFAQIDGRTGKPAENCYGAFSMCFNNPEYRETYFNYVRTVVDTGIDGIMNDDVSFFGDMNACTCRCCREKFFTETGYTLPDPEHWSGFFERYDNPAYLAWRMFKHRSTARFYRDLSALYESMGKKLLRPNYHSDFLKHNEGCYPFDRTRDIWTCLFQENCSSAVMKQSYMDFWVEAVQRYSAGIKRGVPSMSMFYPENGDDTYFAWSLSRFWGQLYTGTFEGKDITANEAPYRAFERKYMPYYTAPRRVEDLCFYLSLMTRDVTHEYTDYFMKKFLSTMQASLVSGLALTMAFEDDGLEDLLTHKRLVVAYCAVLSDEEIKRFSDYASRGGKLMVIGDFGTRDHSGAARSAERIAELLGISLCKDVSVPFGKGEILFLDPGMTKDDFQPTIWTYRHGGAPGRSVASKWDHQKAKIGDRLAAEVGKKAVRVECANDRVLAAAYRTEAAFTLQVVNLADTIADSVKEVYHRDVIEHFAVGAEKLPVLTLFSDLPSDKKITSVRLVTPESADEVVLPFAVSDGVLSVTVPAGTFAGYALIIAE